MTNDSCNALFDTNHFWLLGTPDNLERAETRREGEVLENEQLWLLTDKNPLLMGQQQCVLITKQNIFKLRQICCSGWVHMVKSRISLHPKQPSKCFLMQGRWCSHVRAHMWAQVHMMSYSSSQMSLHICHYQPLQRREGNSREFQQLAKELNVLLLDLGWEFRSLGSKASPLHTGVHCSAPRGPSKV